MELPSMISGQTASWPAASSISPLVLQKRNCRGACGLFALDLFWWLLPLLVDLWTSELLEILTVWYL